MQTKKITTYLERLGLSDLEAQIYVTLLNSGPVGVRKLADLIEIKQTRTYRHIDSLIEKGLVIKIIRGSRKQVAVSQPEKALQALVEEKLQSAKSIESEFSDILQVINEESVLLEESNNAEIQYYKGKAGVRKIYEEAVKSSELRLYANFAELIKFLPEDLSLFSEALKSNPGLKIFELISDTPESVGKYNLDQTARTNRYFYKFIPHIGLTSAGILIYDNTVATVLTIDKKISVIVLRSKDYYTDSKKLFDFTWSTLPEMDVEEITYKGQTELTTSPPVTSA